MNIRRFAVLVVASAAVLLWAGDRAPLRAQFAPQAGLEGISPGAQAQIAALLAEKASRTPAQRKIDPQLLFAQRMARRQAIANGIGNLAVSLPMTQSNRVMLDVRAAVTPGLVQRLRQRGIDVLRQDASTSTLQLEATLDQVDTLASFVDVHSIEPMQRAITWGAVSRQGSGGRAPRPRARTIDREALRASVLRALGRQDFAVPNTGSKVSEGDLTHKANVARSAWGLDGTGVRIGVLSDGVRNLASAQDTGDLGAVTIHGPAVGILCGTNRCDEGTAMLEIVHDIAPGAELFFASAFDGTATFADNIRALRYTYGCDIIIDDVFYLNESPFQDGHSWSAGGIVAQAVKGVAADGALYFSSAGNGGNLDAGTSGTWEGDFVSGGTVTLPGFGVPSTKPAQRFGVQNYNVVTAAGQWIHLYWSDPLGQSANDYDIFLVSPDGTSVIGGSTREQTGTQDPYEEVVGAFPVGTRIVVILYQGDPRFLHLSNGRGQLQTKTFGQTHGHSATSAVNSFGVAATPARSPGPSPSPFNSGNKVETFSSDGPRRLFFDMDGTPFTPGNVTSTGGLVLNKPDLTAADRVSVTGAGGFPTTFSGTSAAAPHAGAIAALIKSADLSLTATQVRTALLNSAIDIQAFGVDRNSGVGIVMADTGVANVLGPLLTLEQPAAGATLAQPFEISGWAIDRSALTGTGIDEVHVYATRLGEAGQLMGVATYGSARPDVGAAYGARFATSGFELTITGLTPGAYTLSVFVHSTTTNTFRLSQAVTVTITSQPITRIDAPADGSTVRSSFTVSGWAVDRAASAGPGVDAVEVWASPAGGGANIFLGDAVYGASRPDVASLLGSNQFTNSGYSLAVAGLAPGDYELLVSARSTVSGEFNNSSAATITVTGATVVIETPLTDASVGLSFQIAGWAVDLGASSGPGVDAVHVWAFPASGAGATFLGVASFGIPRPDIDAAFGSEFTNSGYSLSTSGLTPGTYLVVAYAHSTVSDAFNGAGGVTVTVGAPQSQPLLFIDVPGHDATVSRPFTVLGWAVDRGSTSGTGVDAVHVWAIPVAGGSAVFIGAAQYGTSRPDVAGFLGDSRFANCGYSISVPETTLPEAGEYELQVFAHSTVADAFNQVRVVRVTVQ